MEIAGKNTYMLEMSFPKLQSVYQVWSIVEAYAPCSHQKSQGILFAYSSFFTVIFQLPSTCVDGSDTGIFPCESFSKCISIYQGRGNIKSDTPALVKVRLKTIQSIDNIEAQMQQFLKFITVNLPAPPKKTNYYWCLSVSHDYQPTKYRDVCILLAL